MQFTNSAQRYGIIAQLLHWAMALLIIVALAIGLVMTEMDKSSTKWLLYSIHKSLGISILILVILRFGWRLVGVIPQLPQQLPFFAKIAAKIGHYLMYVMMFAIPITGWVMSSAGGHAVKLWGLELPAIVEENEWLGEIAGELHEFGGWALIWLVGLHMLAAIWHQYINKDGMLHRMLPW